MDMTCIIGGMAVLFAFVTLTAMCIAHVARPKGNERIMEDEAQMQWLAEHEQKAHGHTASR